MSVIGVDIIEMDRIEKAIRRHGDRFINYVYSKDEQALAQKKKSPITFWAGRWAAKEAVYKVLSANLDLGIAWTDIEILSKESGAPYVHLKGKAKDQAQKLGIQTVHVSISHCKSHAVANAFIEK
ncbi:MAG: holo-ACP synthase [Bdellovibrionales bacterium]|nr:holo-ACP synthase [Bdellovibrionales bacterium]